MNFGKTLALFIALSVGLPAFVGCDETVIAPSLAHYCGRTLVCARATQLQDGCRAKSWTVRSPTPYGRDALFAVTVSGAFVTVSVPFA